MPILVQRAAALPALWLLVLFLRLRLALGLADEHVGQPLQNTTLVPNLVAARSVVIGAGANMLFKGLFGFVLGSGAVRRWILPLFVLATSASVAAAFLLVR